MTTRELWHNIMHYGQFDRMPVTHWTGWTETLERWVEEGMPPDVDEHQYFNAVKRHAEVEINHLLYPAFEEEPLEETDEYRIFRDRFGVVQQDWKHKSCIPHYIDFTLKGAKDWPDYKRRLQPDPGRLPDDLDEQIARMESSGLPVRVNTCSMMGSIRDWMGVLNFAYLMHDDPEVFADMVDTISDLACWIIDVVASRMKGKPDLGFGWEDICGKNGPLINPKIFDRCVAPGYLKIRNKLEQYGVAILGIDTDGYVEPLVKHWLDAGVNLQFPIEIGTWNADPMEFRRKYGKELRIIGGFNKLVLEKGPAAIDAEIERRIPLMKDGGYIIMPDHLITPGTSLENYKYYLDRIRQLRF